MECPGGDQERGQVFRRFTKIAKLCHKLHNFNSFFAIYSGLTSDSINRLRLTRSSAGERAEKRMLHMQQLCSSNKNFARLREELGASTPPLIPYLGLFLTDLVRKVFFLCMYIYDICMYIFIYVV